jgi:hypothetical protein
MDTRRYRCSDAADETSDAPPYKRARMDQSRVEEMESSIESMLAIPVEIIFREVAQKPLLTRSEADCLLAQKRYCNLTRKKIAECKHPFMLPIIPIVTLFERQHKPTLRHVQDTLGNLMSDLDACSTTLRQSAEQNWTLSESLIDALDGLSDNVSGQSIAYDKRKLAELEDDICQRIEKLVTMAKDRPSENKSQDESDTNSRLDTSRTLFRERRSDTSSQNTRNNQDIPPLRNLSLNKFSVTRSSAGTIGGQPIDATRNRVFADNGDSFPVQTQPDNPQARRSSDEEDEGYNQSNRNGHFLGDSRTQESQNSFRNKSSAAEALAVLALGQPGL